MAGELEAVVRAMFAAFDRNDFVAALQAVAEDTQGVDEISRRWLHGRAEVEAHARHLQGVIADVHSELRDLHETTWDDTGVLTGWLEQDYTLAGQRQHISAPTSVVLRREAGGWRIVLFHAIPLPKAST